MTDRHALLAACRLHPAEDTPRLALADWLEEHGEPERAELIRVQVELARLPEPEIKTFAGRHGHHATRPDGVCADCTRAGVICRYHETDAREAVLSNALRRQYPVGFVCVFHSGILEAVECTAAAWLAHGDAVYERERPWVVRLTTGLDWYRVAGDVVLTSSTFGPNATKRICQLVRETDVVRETPVVDVLAAEWPGVDFELPPEPTGGPEWRRQLRDSARSGLSPALQRLRDRSAGTPSAPRP